MSLRSLIVRIVGDKSGLDSTLKGAEGSMNSFGSVVKKIGGLLGIAFGLREIVNFSKEAMKLAAEAEGVKNAFMKIGDAKSVLEDMKKATRGVMDESDLMQLAVKAQNFNIPLKDLSKYFEFATNRAITTGKSVSELTDLIVTGLGRKSSRSFIQLGLSAKDVQEAFKTTGGMMNLVTGALEKMGPVADTAAIRLGQVATNVKNLKEAWGEFLNNSPAINAALKWINDELIIFADTDLNIWQKLNGSPNEYIEWKKNQAEIKQAFIDQTNKTFPGLIDGLKKVADQTKATTKETNKLAESINRIKGPKSIGGLTPSVNNDSNKIDPETVAITHAFINGITDTTKLAPGPAGAALAMAQATAKAAEAQSIADDDLEEQVNRLTDILRYGKDMAADMAGQMLEGIGEALAGGDIKDLGRNLLSSFADFMATFGKMLIAFGIAQSAFYKALAAPGPHTAVIAIAAGAAMLVAAGAIKGLMARGSSNVSGSSSSGGGSYASSGTQTIKIVGELKGKDIYFSQQRYANDSQ